jgi:hypothetical protein
MNHIATGRALSPRGELLPPHRGRQQRRWRWLRGNFPIPAGCQNRDFCPPKFIGGGGGAAELLLEKTLIPLGFSRWRELIGGRAVSEVDQGLHTIGWHAQGSTCATPLCGGSLAPLRLSFGLRHTLGKIGTLAFVLSNSENISCVAFLKHKNSRKQGTDTVASR